jgi:membrane-associated PAP2 superfamily phosphatase
MSGTGLMVALAIAAAVGIVFGVAPELEIAIARPFHDIMRGANNFGLRIDPTVLTLRDTGMWLVAALVAPAVVALILKVALPRRRMLIPGRAAIFLIATLALAPGVLVNVALKEYWGRSRPIDVTVLGGSEKFVAWWDPRGQCPGNCSFVSGDVSGAFWTLAPAALAPPPWRALAYGGALAFGTGMSFMRMAAGAHFLTDVVFAGFFTFLVIWLVHGLIYRWSRTRTTDEAVEGAIERVAAPAHDYVIGLFRKPRGRSGA